MAVNYIFLAGRDVTLTS